MKFITPIILLTTAGGAYLQCLTPNDNYESAPSNLSGVTDFGLDLFRKLGVGQSNQNHFISPYSIWATLALAYLGAEGKTRKQLQSVLRISDKISTLKHLRKIQQNNSTQHMFSTVNRIYFEENLQVRTCLKEILGNNLQTLKANDTAGSVKYINDLVSKTTKGLIKNLVKEEDLVKSLMVLVNAAYFQGIWKDEFESSSTIGKKDFFITPSDPHPIDMMSLKKRFNYGTSQELAASILELPYKGDTLSMYLFLPFSDVKNESNFRMMVNNLTGDTFREAIGNMGNTRLNLLLPKFKLKTEFGKELKEALQALGINDLFDPSRANLSTFSPSNGLAVDKVKHKAFVDVNEKGTEAVSATGFATLYSMPRSIDFNCNHPFVFVIYDKKSSSILFLGAFKDPRALRI